MLRRNSAIKMHSELYFKRIREKLRYGNKQNYMGMHYDSILEANYAEELDYLLENKKIYGWQRQKKIEIRLRGYFICNYYIDFVVTQLDGSLQYVEVKGLKSELFMIKWRILETFKDEILGSDSELIIIR